MEDAIKLRCRACGSHVSIRPGPRAKKLARECTVCPVCWAVGPAYGDAAPRRGRRAPGRRDSAVVPTARPVVLGRSRSYRLLGCVRPEGPELAGEPAERRELARMLWRLAGQTHPPA